jgi:inner membrane protein YhjD
LNLLKRSRLVRTALAVNRRYGEDGGSILAASITYYAFLSLFPLILLALAGIGFVLAGDRSAQAEWSSRLSGSVPGLGPLIADNIDTLVESRGGAGVIGVAGLLWSGTGLTNAAGYALSRVFRRPEKKGFLTKTLWSISSTLGLGLVALAGVVVSGAVGGLRGTGAVAAGLVAAAFVVSFVLDVCLFAVSYRVLIEGSGVPLRQLWPGALLGGAGWTVLKVAGSWYAARTVANASEVYGTFGSVVGILALLYLAARLFLYGAELNALLMEERRPQ